MKLAILSDFHFGFGQNSERENDPFEAVKEALGKTKGVDIIILGGDLFDTKTPDADILSRAMELLVGPLLTKSQAKLVDVIGKDRERISPMSLMGTPVIAIHGTHERRVKGLTNPVEALEKAGFLIYLHCNGVMFEKNGEKICIQGMSGVPDQYAENVLKNWNPKPIPDCFNLFILHQSITEFLYAPHTIDLNKLPKGFDLYINGHIHEAKKSEYLGKPFLLTGSVIPTQLKKEESERNKGFWFVDTETLETKWAELEKQRGFFFREFRDPDIQTIEKELNLILGKEHEKKPIVRLSLTGDFSEGLIKEIETKFSGKALISFKKEMKEEEIPTKTLEEHKLSVEELGKKLLSENLKKFKLDPKLFENVFELLASNKMEEAEKLLEEILETRKETPPREEKEPEKPKEEEKPQTAEKEKTKIKSDSKTLNEWL